MSGKLLPVRDIDAKLICAIYDCNPDEVRECIRLGANVNCETNKGWSLAEYAFYHYDDMSSDKWDEVLDILIDSGMNFNKRLRRNVPFGFPLILALYLLNEPLGIKMIERGAELNIKDRFRVTPVIAAARCSKGIALKMLLDKGADINGRESLLGYTAIHEAVEQNCPENVILLVEAGADVNAPDYDGISPLALALDDKRIAMAKLLLDAGAELAGVAENLLTDEIRAYIPDRTRIEASAPTV